jgi:putative drug exporter of the RND superfamily
MHTSRRAKWLSLALWLALAVIAFPFAGKLADVQNSDAAAWLPKTAEATLALERAEAAFPGSGKLVAVVVYERAAGVTPADLGSVETDRAAFASFADQGAVSPAITSADGAAVIISFPLAAPDDAAVDLALDDIRARLDQAPDGLQTALTGSAGAIADISDAFSGVDGLLIMVTGVIVAVLLLITYRSPVLWIVPLISVGFASQFASAIVYLLAKHTGVTVNPQSAGIMTVLVFGVGTDYALLLIARYREELRRHADRHKAMAVALRRSIPAILASAATVAVGLLCLLAAQMNNVRGLGPVGAAGIVAAFAVMVGLLPVLLVVCGRWLFWPFVPRFDPEAAHHDIAEEHGIWRRIAGFVSRRPRAIWLATTVGLVAMMFGTVGLNLGLPASEAYTKDVGSVAGQRMISTHFDGGTGAPAEITARADRASDVATAARDVAGVASVGEIETSGEWARMAAVLAEAPDSDAAKDTVDALRAAVHEVPEADALVGGATATMLDTERASARDNWVVLPLVLIVVFGVLILLLRSLVAPVLLVVSVLLSFGAAVGGAGLILQAIGYPNIGYELPLLSFLFLVALGVDYSIFLATRAREEAATLGAVEGMKHAMTVTGGVITSAGIVLAATFGAFGVLPLVASLQLALVVSLGVLLDTFVVRTLMVPAMAMDIGRRFWWPNRLAAVQAREESQEKLPARV